MNICVFLISDVIILKIHNSEIRQIRTNIAILYFIHLSHIHFIYLIFEFNLYILIIYLINMFSIYI